MRTTPNFLSEVSIPLSLSQSLRRRSVAGDGIPRTSPWTPPTSPTPTLIGGMKTLISPDSALLTPSEGSLSLKMTKLSPRTMALQSFR